MLARRVVVVLACATMASSKSCLECICNKESGGCKPMGCYMDEGSLSCGYYSIKLEYYIDCGTPGIRYGESTEKAWKRCADDYDCATRCVHSYIARYKHQCPGRLKCERMARLHNGGPYGCDRHRTISYWNDINNCYYS